MRDIFRLAKRPGMTTRSGRRRSRWILILLLIALVVVANQSIPLYIDWLWFEAVGFSSVLRTILLTQGLLALLFGGICF
ncbi:MAG: UPF0182 family protein, partial [Candidatus Methylomirabilales bacterium]